MMSKRMILSVVSLTLFTLGGATLATLGGATMAVQTFDTQAGASADGWTEFGSRINNFDFGFSSTNNAEGTASGEGGGTIARSEPLGYYGDVTLGGMSDLSIDLVATGRLKFQDSAFDGEFFFGYFSFRRVDRALASRDVVLGEPQVLPSIGSKSPICRISVKK